MIKVGIIEDNTSLRGSLTKLVDGHAEMTCVMSAGSLLHIVSDLVNATPQVLLLDIGLPHISGIEGVKMIKMSFPDIQILMFTVFEDEDKIFEAIRAGASGYLLKKTPPDEILAAIIQLTEGGAPMTASIARKVIQSFQAPPLAATGGYSLTPREKEILYGLVDGLSYKKIAEKNFVSISTIRTHICNIYAKLHVHSKAQAVAKVLQHPGL